MTNLCLCVLVQEVNLLFPQISEIIGGSVREESYDKLMGEIEARNIPMKDMNWYLDTRKYGSCPHAGFGLGFERLILFVTGMQNIPEIVECHFTTGSYTMLIKLYARDNEQLMDLLNNKLQAIPGVVSTETLISLEQSIKREIPVLLDED